MTQRVKATSAGVAVKSATATTSSPSDYKPAPGDVVEFGYNGKTVQGLVFWYIDKPGIAAKWEADRWAYSNEFAFGTAMETARKIGETDLVTDKTGNGEILSIAKAYFSKKSTLKVGDRVRIIKAEYSLPVGTLERVVKVDSDGDVWLGGDYCYSPKWIELVKQPTFTGTYEERQKQAVEHYGWKVGSKAKIIKPNTDNEDGSLTPKHDQRTIDRCGSVGIVHKIMPKCIKLKMDGDYVFLDMPYFCLQPA